MLRRYLLSFSLILLFAFGQQGAAVHEISHYADWVSASQQQQDKSAAHISFCDKCLVYGELASAINVTYFSPALLTHQFETAHYSAVSHRNPAPSAYSARAPPVLA
jgi:hypothetical protein